MRFLVDMPVSFQLAVWLNEQGHDAVHASHIGLFNAKDVLIIKEAVKQNRVIITSDLDFPQILAISRAQDPGVVLFRGGNYSDHEMIDLLKRVLERYPEERLAHAITVVDKARIRRCPLPVE